MVESFGSSDAIAAQAAVEIETITTQPSWTRLDALAIPRLCATSIRSRRAKRRSAICFAPVTTALATCRCFPGIFPDQMAPIVRRGADGERELVMARWGMPGPPPFGGQPITDVLRIVASGDREDRPREAA